MALPPADAPGKKFFNITQSSYSDCQLLAATWYYKFDVEYSLVVSTTKFSYDWFNLKNNPRVVKVEYSCVLTSAGSAS